MEFWSINSRCRLQRAMERCAALGLHDNKWDIITETERKRCCEGTSSDLNKHRLRGYLNVVQLIVKLPTNGSTTIEAPRICRTLNAEGDCPLRHRLSKRTHSGIACGAGGSFTTVDLSTKGIKTTTEGVVHPCRNEHSQRPFLRTRNRRSSERRIPTRRDRKWWPLGQHAELFSSDEVQHDANKMARFMRSTYSNRLIFRPH